MGIPTGIITNLRDELLRCGPFSSKNDLMPFFVDDRISAWRHYIPNATNPAALVDALIEYLHDHYNTEEENALVLFVQTLSERQPPGDNCGSRLAQLAHKLATVLGSRPRVAASVPEMISIDETISDARHFAHVVLDEFRRSSYEQEGQKRIEQIVNYAVRLARERQGQGADLTQAEWIQLVGAIWLRVYEGRLPDDLAPSYLAGAQKIANVQVQDLFHLPAETIVAGQQLRLRLLAALLLLVNILHIDNHSIAERQPEAPPDPEALVDGWLRQYVQGVLIRAGKIGLIFTVPDTRYTPLLQIWIAGKVQRFFNQIIPALIDEEWHLWLVSSTNEINSDLPLLPDVVWQQLSDEQTLRRALDPLVATLSSSGDGVLSPVLTPVPLTSLRQPPTRLSWRLPPLPETAVYEVLLIEEQSGQKHLFEQLPSSEVELQGIDWKAGHQYRWSVLQRLGRRRHRLTSGHFHLLNKDSYDALAQAEAQMSPGAAHRQLWYQYGLYEAIISSLLDTIFTGSTVVERLASRRELAECFEHIASQARQRNLLSTADEYQSLAIGQYNMLRRTLKEHL